MAKTILETEGILKLDDIVLTNYAPIACAVVMEFGCMQGVVVRHHPVDCLDEEEKK